MKFSIYLNRRVFVMEILFFTYRLRNAKTFLRAYADSEGLTQPAHFSHMIRPSLSSDRIIGYYRMFQWRAKKKIDTSFFLHQSILGFGENVLKDFTIKKILSIFDDGSRALNA